MDSAFHGAPACRAARTAGAHFSVTVPMDPKVRTLVTGSCSASAGSTMTGRLRPHRTVRPTSKSQPMRYIWYITDVPEASAAQVDLGVHSRSS
jgi:hypothetical protein